MIVSARLNLPTSSVTTRTRLFDRHQFISNKNDIFSGVIARHKIWRTGETEMAEVKVGNLVNSFAILFVTVDVLSFGQVISPYISAFCSFN